MPSPPFTTPIILTTPTNENNNNNSQIMPVELNIILNESFFTRSTINPFIEGMIKMVFNVPNPGYDMILKYNTEIYPIFLDQYGHEWKANKRIDISFIKEETKFTYPTGEIPVKTRYSMSEQATIIEGEISDDSLCISQLACCPLNNGSYIRYALIQSPVPSYQCTNSSVVYGNPSLTFKYQGNVLIGDENFSTICDVDIGEINESRNCIKNELQVFVKTIPLEAIIPRSSFALCRSGLNLTDNTYSTQPIFVTLCEMARCIGYTESNYRIDRGICGNSPLGYYTAVDRNNTNQFSYYERVLPFTNMVPNCIWINDIVMGPNNTLNELSIRCNMSPSNNWSIIYNFPKKLPLLNFITPNFPYGRVNHIEAQYTLTNEIKILIEFISFSPSNSIWTLIACNEKNNENCFSFNYSINGINEWKPLIIETLIPQNIMNFFSLQNPSAIILHVECLKTPIKSPFRFLFNKTHILIKSSEPILHKGHMNIDLAKQPYEKILSPSETNGKMIKCIDDFKFSKNLNKCIPFTDNDCKKRYNGRRNKFDIKIQSCIITLTKRTEKIHSIPIPLRKVPEPTFDKASQRKFLEEIKLPPWMKSMKELLKESDEAEISGKRETSSSSTPFIYVKTVNRNAVLIMNIFFIIGIIICIILMWKRDNILDWLCYQSQLRQEKKQKKEEQQRQELLLVRNRTEPNGSDIIMEIVPARLSSYLGNSNLQTQGGESIKMGIGSSMRFRAQQEQQLQEQQKLQLIAHHHQQHQLMLQQQLIAQQQQQQQQLIAQQQQQQLIAHYHHHQQLQQHQQTQQQWPREIYYNNYNYNNMGITPIPLATRERYTPTTPPRTNEPYYSEESQGR